MTKLELLKLIENIEDENKDIDEVILGNGFAKPINDETGFNDLVATNQIVQSMLDGRVSKALNTYQNGTEKQRIEEAREKLRAELTGANETPDQKALREMREEIKAIKLEKQLAETGLKYKDVFEEAKIPKELHNFVLGKDIDENVINERLEIFKGAIGNLQKQNEEVVQSQVNERLNGGYKPPANTENLEENSYENMINKDNLSFEEALKIWE